jgi:kynurenine formamidase
MSTRTELDVKWQLAEVTSPRLGHPVSVVVARDIPYLPHANRLQNLSIYLPQTAEASDLIGTPATFLPTSDSQSLLPRYHVHVHGGAWRDPELTSTSIEPTVAHAFSAADRAAPIIAIASINYTISPFPTRPALSYDAVKDHHSDPAREAIHPQHVGDVLKGLDLLRSFGLSDRSYILSGHSCGATIAFQAILQTPESYELHVPDAPCPAALLGLNGLYDLPALVNGLDASHEGLRDDYEMLLSSAFGEDKDTWCAASPARFDPTEIAERVREGKAPRLVVLDQSTEDQLVPMNQRQRLKSTLESVSGLGVIEGHRCTGTHAAPWEQGTMIWENLRDIAALLRKRNEEER